MQVVSKNKVVESGSFNVNSAGIPIIVTREMAPSARIVAYFVQPDREIVADGLNFVVDEIYENKVSTLFITKKVSEMSSAEVFCCM